MLKFELLQSRFQQVRQHQSQLSTLEAFLLLTTDPIELHWKESQQKTALKQFSGWQFEAKQASFYCGLIDWLIQHLSQDTFIQQLAQKQHWYEQWMMFYLHHQQLNQKQMLATAKIISQHQVSIYHVHLLQYIAQSVPCFDSIFILAEFYLQQRQYDHALRQYQLLIQKYCQSQNLYQAALIGLVKTLLARQKHFNINISDAEYAFNILATISRHQIWNSEFEQLLQQAREQVLIASLKQGRGKATSTLKDIGRGLNLFSKGLGKKLGGKESSLPYSKDVIASAAVLLTGLDIENSLNQPRFNRTLQDLLKPKLSQHEAAITASGLSLGMLWTYSQIDTQVLDAISFASAGSPTAFSDLQDISEQALDSAGAITRLSGYIAEQQVALNLVRRGHHVEMPDTSNQVGWDLLVDGTPIQVKCSLDANYVLQHFEKYPDIPVITNAELAEQLGSHPLVMIDPNLSYTDIQNITHDSLQHLADFNSFSELSAIPLLAVAFAAHRHYGQWSSGRLNLQQYGQNIGTDVAIRSAGAVSGKVIGATLGSLFSPVGTIIGAGVGAYIGGLASGTGAEAILNKDLCLQRDVVVRELIAFAQWFNADVMKVRLAQLQQQQKDLKQKILVPLQRASHFSEQPIYAQLLATQYEHLHRTQSLYDWINTQLKDSEFYQAQAGWVALGESGKFFHQEMKTRVARINQALEQYERLAKPKHVTETTHHTLSLKGS
mgnify:CR=1 FL=1